ncbi:MAG: hypothetical protein NZ869_05885 [Thermoanaerobaculum sp.]|nr:hypothetical protein [Thermoanaerobaculum sp.]MDW7967659.1 hypothetical protein [Thermoanaerobaculum sp.]
MYSKNPRQALELALEGPGLAVDAGHLSSPANSVSLLNVASAGISGLVDLLVNANPRQGGGAFLAATLTALRQNRGQWVAVQLDGWSVVTGLALLVAVANGKSFGKGMRVAPNARLDNGRLDVVVVEALPWRRLLLRLPLLYLGRHLRLPQVRFRQGERVLLEVEGSSPPFDVDGECYAAGPATFSVRSRAWHIAWAF